MVALFQYFRSVVRPRVMACDAWSIKSVLRVGKQESTRKIGMEGKIGRKSSRRRGHRRMGETRRRNQGGGELDINIPLKQLSSVASTNLL